MPDIATEIMHNIFSDMDNVEFYMDDISCFSNSWEEHLGLLEEVLHCLESILIQQTPTILHRPLYDQTSPYQWHLHDPTLPKPNRMNQHSPPQTL